VAGRVGAAAGWFVSRDRNEARPRTPATALVSPTAAPRAGVGVGGGGKDGASGASFRQLTFRRGWVHAARFSPDGQTVVYSASWHGARPELFAVRTDGPESRALGFKNAGIFAISRTGEMAMALNLEHGSCNDGCLAADDAPTVATSASLVSPGNTRRRSIVLARAPLAGGAAREVDERISAADWSPERTQLAIMRSKRGQAVIEYPLGKPVHRSAGWITWPRISPDGSGWRCSSRSSTRIV